MLVERIEAKGLAHYSYLIAKGNEAAVIDPRRDCAVYLERAQQEGVKISHILETHRNEDYVVGSRELAARCGASVWHANGQWPYEYGEAVEDGQTFSLGKLKLQALHCPGHTSGSMSYVLHEAGGNPWMVFTGDSLFAGDVGRVDLLGEDKAEEMAASLYQSLFEKLLKLGDGVIACPAHGAGSVCGADIAQRPWTTIGIERLHNPQLQHATMDEFVAAVAKPLERPPYFTHVEEQNLKGPDLVKDMSAAGAITPDEVASRTNELTILDTRMELAFGAALLPGVLSIWQGGVAAFVGWFLDHSSPLMLVKGAIFPDAEIRALHRLGYDNIAGYLAGGMLSWHTSGRESQSVPTLTVQQLCCKLDAKDKLHILDVRSEKEREASGHIPEAQEIHVTQVARRAGEIPAASPPYIFCGSGLCSMIAASLLQQRGYENVTVVLGGLAGWHSTACPVHQ